MRLRQIEVFHAIYTTGSMTNAAAMLNVSQPSISKVLAHAEQQLGYRLFDRVKGKLIPTPEAHQLFVHVKAVYKDVDQLRHVASNIKEAGAGRIRVAGTPAFGLEVLPKAVASFQREHPGTVFEIETLHRVIRDIPKPVIAAVNGVAVGGGHVLHVLCDITIAADHARFGQAGPRVGSFDAGFGSAFLDIACPTYSAKKSPFLQSVKTARPFPFGPASMTAVGMKFLSCKRLFPQKSAASQLDRHSSRIA